LVTKKRYNVSQRPNTTKEWVPISHSHRAAGANGNVFHKVVVILFIDLQVFLQAVLGAKWESGQPAFAVVLKSLINCADDPWVDGPSIKLTRKGANGFTGTVARNPGQTPVILDVEDNDKDDPAHGNTEENPG
jgi:hypothetical protein